MIPSHKFRKQVGVLFVFFVVLCVGCSRETDPNAASRGSNAGEKEGVENADRETAERYFVALDEVQSAEEEEKLLKEFGQWLRENEYRIQVEAKSGKHRLSCPYFPPVTPWTDHTFFDAGNLALLPRFDEGR
ncbi:MAG: hypothetical protein HKN23_16720 [Verrucomicrobiales bacterium]|nr:hypothetical protein [Verrucomicrobiales bacterium]